MRRIRSVCVLLFSVLAVGWADTTKSATIFPTNAVWKYSRGLSEASSPDPAAAIAIGAMTYSSYDPAKAAAEASRFRQCYTGVGDNCVLDGDTIYVQREKVEIAGVDAPEIRGGACGDERERGTDAAVRLADLLDGGEVTVGDPFRDQYGRLVSSVAVNGKDVAKSLIAARVVRQYNGEKHDWCRKAA
jgi:endonuclease YncB( thermonuclease family)